MIKLENKSVVVVVPEMLPVPSEKGGAVEYWVEKFVTNIKGRFKRVATISRPASSKISGVDSIFIQWDWLSRLFWTAKNKYRNYPVLRAICKLQNVCSYGVSARNYINDFDFVYLHNEPNLLLFFRKRKGQKIVLHMHNDHLSHYFLKYLYRFLLRKVDHIIFVSDCIRRSAMIAQPSIAYKSSVCLNPVDADFFSGMASSCSVSECLGPGLNILYVGRLAEIKGVHVLINSFSDYLRIDPTARLIIAGASFFGDSISGGYDLDLKKIALPLKNNIYFTGHLPLKDISDLYSLVNVVCVPSIWPDPCPLVVLEAMASKAVVIASEVGGIPEIIKSGETGFLVEPANSAALTVTLNNVASLSSMERDCIASAARDHVLRNHSWSEVEGRVLSVFSQEVI